MYKIIFKEPQTIIQHGIKQVCLFCHSVYNEDVDGVKTHIWFSYNLGDIATVQNEVIESIIKINPNEL